jgi:hypothetical protein
MSMHHTIIAGVRRAIGDHIVAVRARGNVHHVLDGLLSMYARTLLVLTQATHYADRDRARGRRILPALAGRLLAEELQQSGELPECEFEVFTQAVNLLAERRGAGAVLLGAQAPVALHLSLQMDRTAGRLLIDWAAGAAAEDAIALDDLESIFADKPEERIDRCAEFKRFQEQQRRLGESVTVARFARAFGISTRGLYRWWFSYKWADSSAAAQKVRALMEHWRKNPTLAPTLAQRRASAGRALRVTH